MLHQHRKPQREHRVSSNYLRHLLELGRLQSLNLIVRPSERNCQNFLLLGPITD